MGRVLHLSACQLDIVMLYTVMLDLRSWDYTFIGSSAQLSHHSYCNLASTAYTVYACIYIPSTVARIPWRPLQLSCSAHTAVCVMWHQEPLVSMWSAQLMRALITCMHMRHH